MFFRGSAPGENPVLTMGDSPMALQQTLQTQPVSGTAFSEWNPVCHITYTRDTWVNLLQAPNVYAADEAKLLCQVSDSAWVAWVPDHGEVVLDRSHFYC